MLKKIQQYLLLNHPLLWNIKVVPAIIGAIIINLFFFVVGYLITEIDFTDIYSYYGNPFSGGALIYMGAVLTSILLFIIWLVFYSKNNAFKSFYPKSRGGLYSEWVLTFVIILGFVLFPFSYYQGTVTKVKSYAGKQEMIEAVETLNQIRILIPTEKTSYYQEYPVGLGSRYSNNVPNMDIISPDTSNTLSYEDQIKLAESQTIHYENYPDFAQLSLLNYGVSSQFYIPEGSGIVIRDSQNVTKWLKEQNREEISKLMDKFIALQNKHNLTTNLTKDQWMDLVYNPSKYPVGDFNLICSYNYKSRDSVFGYYYSGRPVNTEYFVSYDELQSGYSKILDAYVDKGGTLARCMVAICLALSISLFVFSFRATTGKSWLIALISIGLILFINGIVSFSVAAPFGSNLTVPLFYIFVLLAIFSCEMVAVLRKNGARKAKGKSDIYINHLIWFVPAVPALIFTAVYLIGHDQYSYVDSEYKNKALYETYLFMNQYIMELIWANICLTFVSMWFFIGLILRKWKSLPEQ